MIKEMVTHPIFLTLVIVCLVLAAKALVEKVVKHKAQGKDQEKEQDIRHAFQNIRHVINFVMVLLLLYVWSTEIQNFALSIAAFAVAIVIATREFIQCVIGFFYLVTTRPFRIGDWIQVGDYYGEVAETDWIKTTLHEIDMDSYQFSRKTIFIPNNKLITSSIKNLNFIKRFATHHFVIARKDSLDPYPIYAEICAKAKQYCENFQDVAARYNSIIERKLNASISGPEPEVHFGTTELGDFKASFTLFCPTEKALEIEHHLTQDFMQLWYQEVKKQKSLEST